jgi:hypothetical protein
MYFEQQPLRPAQAIILNNRIDELEFDLLLHKRK